MKAKRLAAMALCFTMLGTGMAFAGEETAEDPYAQITANDLSMQDALVTEISVTVDGEPVSVTVYEDCYVMNPTNLVQRPYASNIDQMVSIYVPEGADETSPILYCVNNAGWSVNGYGTRVQVTDGTAYESTDDTNLLGYALAHKYVIVSYGARSRGDKPVDDRYTTHAPATITDTKAVIRYLRYNAQELPAGDTEKIIITGWSGGGALSAIVASSGNSEDFYPSLYEIGAAGIEPDGDTFVSTIRDDVYAVIAYCPINDLRKADEAYEYTYHDVRQRILDEGVIVREASESPFMFALPEDYSYEDLMTASESLAADYPVYVESLGLLTSSGDVLSDANLREETIALLEQEIAATIEEIGADAMLAALDEPLPGATGEYLRGADGWEDWLIIADDGSFTFDYDEYLYWLARNSALKLAPAFSSTSVSAEKALSGQNENSLYGSEDYAYSAFSGYSWDHDAVVGNGCGLDDTDMNFDEYLASEDGALLKLQLQMTSPIPYLTSDNGDSAPYWFVRHGMADRDTSFPLQTVLFHAIQNDDSIAASNLGFGWLQVHTNEYDAQDAWEWLESVME